MTEDQIKNDVLGALNDAQLLALKHGKDHQLIVTVQPTTVEHMAHIDVRAVDEAAVLAQSAMERELLLMVRAAQERVVRDGNQRVWVLVRVQADTIELNHTLEVAP